MSLQIPTKEIYISAEKPTSKEFLYKNSAVTSLELENGKQSSITILFNNSELYFEDVVLFLENFLDREKNVKAYQTTYGNIKNGSFETFAEYHKTTKAN